MAALAALCLGACGRHTSEKPAALEVTAPAFVLPAPGEATQVTREKNAALAKELPLGDQQDFEDARRGFLGAIEGGVIKAETGKVVWDQSRFDFLKGPAPASVNPSLWRQAQLNAVHGLFEVTDGVYQLRGYDLSVMSLIRGDTGWIVIDPLLTKETARAALALANKKLGARPAKAVIFTHSHVDHFGGVRGVVSDDDVKSGRVRIIAPEGFEKAAIGENVLAGNAMARRAGFQFGAALAPAPSGLVDSGIGKTISTGIVGFMAPTETVKATGEKLTIDGVDFEFILAPDTEAPAEMMFYLPQKKALCVAELATTTDHNLLTLRGAKVRDALAWSRTLDTALTMFGDDAQVLFASHGWPVWKNDRVKTRLEHHRDLYRYIHDQTLRLANEGYTMNEIADAIGAPDFVKSDFSVRDYYGTIAHNARATYQRYFGWWDGVPAHLDPLPPAEEAKHYVALAGGAGNMIANAEGAFKKGDYRWVVTVMNDLVFADPSNRQAKNLLAAAYDQLGFQTESAIWRNYYLEGAKELREGVDKSDKSELANPDFIKAVPTPDYFDALAIRLDPDKAKEATIIINFVFSD
ncbi:MAG TPA: alkyl sulfatase dimerization domain-containing protein, partial [Parvularculaceae bacterium]|nr:alkyl sulfatase dimerization domain-containing protein [Parvularculaceae bacterium]